MDEKIQSKSKNNKEGFMLRFMRTFVVIAVAGLFLVNVPSASFAKGKSAKKVKGVKKMNANAYTGTISSVSKRYITIEINREGTHIKEIVIPYDEQTVLTGVSKDKKVTDLAVGNEVKINYTEAYIESDDQRRHEFKRVATQIKLIRGAR